MTAIRLLQDVCFFISLFWKPPSLGAQPLRDWRGEQSRSCLPVHMSRTKGLLAKAPLMETQSFSA